MARGTMCGGGCPLLLLLLLLGVTSVLGAMLPPRLSSHQTTVTLQEGQQGFVLECNKDLGDDPIAYRWLKDHKIVTGVLGYAYRGYNKVFLALHTVEAQHAGAYVCEASNTAGVDSASIRVIVESRERLQQPNVRNQPHTDEILSEIATSLSDVLAEGECKCDTMFFLHVSTDATEETLAVQANLVHIIADQIISETNRVSVMTYSDYTDSKLSFGEGTNKCALKNAFKDLTHEKWPTRLSSVLRETFKKFRKSTSSCKVLFLPIFGSMGTEGADELGAQHLRKLGVKIFILEVTPMPLNGVKEMASTRGDGYPYHWRVPQFIWPTIVMNMKYIAEEVVGCMAKEMDIPGKCVAVDGACTNDTMCRGVGHGCENNRCVYRECNINPREPGCCNDESPINRYWCGDVTSQCTATSNICDGIVQCMNGDDEKHCWSNRCPKDKIARCETSTLCLDLMDLCNGEPDCPGGEDEDPRFCKSFPCPRDRSFRCRSGKCIAAESLCDGVFRDCDEGEDEVFEFCKNVHICPSTHSFKCDYGICISDRMVCDGTFNCLDATDELVCNGVIDGCGDGSDEHNCTEIPCPANRNFKCSNGICIDGYMRCDGIRDCRDGSDELNCPTPPPPMAPKASCPPDMFKCNSGACIPESQVCNGRINCLDGDDEDETTCQQHECPASRPYRCTDGSCVVASAPCNNIKDCLDGSDEINCNNTEDEEDDDYFDEYDYVTETERPPPIITTTTTTPVTRRTKPKETIDKKKEDEETVMEEETHHEEETFVEEASIDTPTELEKPNTDMKDEKDMEGAETILETMEEPAASSEQGVGSSPCITPACILVLTPVFVLTLCNIWMR